MRSRTIISCDDLGLSCGITDNIFDCVDNGHATSVSLIPNGVAFDYAIDEYKKRQPSCRLAIHLNLIEGKPLSSPADIPDLINGHGELFREFQSLWLHWLTCSTVEKRNFEGQIRKELRLQITRVLDRFDSSFDINIDGHQHTHMVPFIFDIVMDLHEEFNFGYVRVVNERIFYVFDGLSSLKCYLGANILKNLLLNHLANRPRRILEEQNISYNKNFVGVLFTGRMTENVVAAATREISRSRTEGVTEILLHPGGAILGEENIWKTRDGLRDIYFSPWRGREKQALKSDLFKVFVREVSCD